jgi:predicted lipoprotein with Yx(FWY)xxD motif
MLLATACGASTQPTTTVVQPAAGSVAASPSSSGATTALKTAGVLAVDSSSELGPLVTDSAGNTLYRFDADTPSPSKSNCDGDCATLWPPVSADDASASDSLNPDLLGWVARTDGSKQLTLSGWPLYYYAKDTAAGQTNGQGVGGKWFAAAADGKKAGVARKSVNVLDSPELGPILQDKNGKTLYLFTKDTPWPMKTACDATCLQKWTPSGLVTAKDIEALGLDPKTIFTFTTPNGTKQEAYNCWPSYTFKGDKEAGQTNGQGVGGVWFAIKKDIVVDRGKTIPAAKAKAGSSSDTSSDTSSADPSSSATDAAANGY